MTQGLRVERIGDVACITLQRPERRNALSREMIEQLRAAFRAAGDDPRVGCVVLTGVPPAFCAGLDLDEVEEALAATSEYDSLALGALYATMRDSPTPCVAAVNGPAVAGGAGLVCVADVAIAGHSASFGYPGICAGLYAPIIMPSLVAAIGGRRARELLLLGDLIDAGRAWEWGLVHEVVDDEAVLTHAMGVARRLAAQPQEVVIRTRAVLRRLTEVAEEEMGDDLWRVQRPGPSEG